MRESLLRIITYHRIGKLADAGGDDCSLFSATAAYFERQVKHLAKHFHVVAAEEVLEAIRQLRPLPERAVLITFDDAYRDFGEVAWPILRQYRLPATLFVPTAYPGDPNAVFWWDQLSRAITASELNHLDLPPYRLSLHSNEARQASLCTLQNEIKIMPHTVGMRLVKRICSELGVNDGGSSNILRWHELRALSNDGVTLGAHTRTHPMLDQVSPEKAREEIGGSLGDLQREIGNVLPIFAYPAGAYNHRVVDLLKKEGVELAVTCRDGHNRISSVDPLRLGRTNITMRTSPAIFALRLVNLFTCVDQWRHRPRKLQ